MAISQTVQGLLIKHKCVHTIIVVTHVQDYFIIVSDLSKNMPQCAENFAPTVKVHYFCKEIKHRKTIRTTFCRNMFYFSYRTSLSQYTEPQQ